MTTTNTALLPCPFCGAKAEMQEEDRNDLPALYWVGCNGCGCATDTDWRAEDAVAAWNKRAATAPTPAAVPSGWRLVPEEPTPEQYVRIVGGGIACEQAKAFYRAMVELAPPAPTASPASTEALTETAIDRAVRALMLHKFGDDAAVMFDIPSDAPEHARAAVSNRLAEARREVMAVAAAIRERGEG